MVALVARLNDVSKSFQSLSGITRVLQGVNIGIEQGQKISVTGASGSGKSTLISLIAGLLHPDTGTVEINGVSLNQLNDSARAKLRARYIGIALQSDNLIPFLTALENVELALSFGDKKVSSKNAYQLLEDMGVAHRASYLPRQISGGETQRVALAVALANNPRLLLADEIVSQLDATTAGTVMKHIFDSDMAVLYVTHNIPLANRADLQLRLEDGQVVVA